MFKIWIKTAVGEKLTRNHLWKSDDTFDAARFREYVYAICTELDIPSPLLLPVHLKNFEEFNFCRFRPEDFVETVDFDFLTLEYCKDQKKTRDLRFYP